MVVDRATEAGHIQADRQSGSLGLGDVCIAVAEYFGLELDQLREKSRQRTRATARQVAAFLARKLTSASFVQIAHYLGASSHSTIVLAAQRIERRLDKGGYLRWQGHEGLQERTVATITAEIESRIRGGKESASPEGSVQEASHSPLGESPETYDVRSPAMSPGYTFDSFVAGPSNRLAHAACQAVAQSPGQAYSPLFIHGGVGLGKTHLLQATCQAVTQSDPKAKVVFLSCEAFVNQFITAIQRGDIPSFRQWCRNADLLVIDDIHFLSGRERTQEEFFHTFNILHHDRKQILLSADRPPAEIAELDDRLVSRFNWGLVARIDRPEYETRLAIVRSKAAIRGIDLPEDVASFIAGVTGANTRELEGALSKVQAMSMVAGCPIDLGLARETFGVDVAPKRPPVSLEGLLQAVAKHYGIRSGELLSESRARSIQIPRQVFMHLARHLTSHSSEEIDGYMGGRDHTTVLHACRAIEESQKQDPQLAADLDIIRGSVTNAAEVRR